MVKSWRPEYLEGKGRTVSTCHTYKETWRVTIQFWILLVKYNWLSDYLYFIVELLMWL